MSVGDRTERAQNALGREGHFGHLRAQGAQGVVDRVHHRRRRTRGARFAGARMPQSFFDGWMRVAFEEAKHFNLIRDRLRALGADYGDLPAHDGLWQAAHDTRNDLTARLAVVPLILEARGLDVTPALQAKMRESGDMESAAVLDIIYEDEKTHVAVGAKWFRFLCQRQGRDPTATFQALVRANFRGPLKPPFNDLARAEAGLSPSFYRALTATSMS